MEAVVYRGARTLRIEPRDAEPPAPGQVAIEVAYTGICGTDLRIYRGDLDATVDPGAVLGHEMSGRVVAVGDGVAGWRAGRAVTVMPTLSCGKCAACVRGHYHVCHAMNLLGVDSPGAMQSIWNVSAELVFPLPESLPLAHAAFVEPVAAAVHDVRRARVGVGEHVVVVGGGPVGVLVAVLCRARGARVLLAEPNAFRRGVAASIGLEAVDPLTTDVVALVNTRTAGAGADTAFEVSGAAGGVETAVGVLATRGRLVMVAVHPRPCPVDLHRLSLRELELFGARLYRRDDVFEAVRLVTGGAIPVERLTSRIVPVRDVGDAFAALDGGCIMKILIDWQGSAR